MVLTLRSHCVRIRLAFEIVIVSIVNCQRMHKVKRNQRDHRITRIMLFNGSFNQNGDQRSACDVPETLSRILLF